MTNMDDIKDTLESPWTSIDLYYKGFHVKKSFPGDYEIDKVVEFVDKAISKHFEPSWNIETSQTQLDPTSRWPKPDKSTCQHPEDSLEVKVAGPNAKRPGAKYVTCKLCGAFVRYA